MADENLNVIDPNMELGDLAKNMGIELPDALNTDKGIVNTGFSFYKHKLGSYVGLMGELGDVVYTVEGENNKRKKVEEGTAGAVATYRMLQIMLLEDPDGKLIDENFNLLPDITYGRATWSQYIPLAGNRQYNNKRLFNSLAYEGVPQLNIIQGGDTDFVVKLDLIKHFYFGAPVNFNVTTSETSKSVWIEEGSLVLRNAKTISKELIQKRTQIANSLKESLAALREAEEAARKEKEKENAGSAMSPDSSGVESPDSMLGSEGFEL